MKCVLTKGTWAAVLLAIAISCRPTENSESQMNTSPAKPATTTTQAPASNSGKGSATENAVASHGKSDEVTADVKFELSIVTRELLGILLRGEVKAAAERLADDFKDTRPDGTVEDKTQYLANLKPFGDYEGFVYDDFKVVSLNGDTAIVSGLVQVSGRDKKSFSGRFTKTFVKRRGKWLLQSSQTTELKPDN